MEIERPDAGPARAPRNPSYPARLRSRLAFALVLSLGLHVLVMLLQFGDADFGLPGLGLPWGERRLKADDLAARLADVARPQAPAPAPARGPLAVVPYVPPEVVEPEVPKPEPKPRPKPKPPRAELPPAPEEASRKAEGERRKEEEAQRLALEETRRKLEEAAQPEILTQSDPQQETFEVPAEAEASRKAEVERRKEVEAQQLALEETKRKEEEAQRLALEEAEARRKSEVERRKVEEAAQREAEELARQRAMALEETRRKEEAAQRLALEVEKQKEEEARRLALEVEKRKEEEAQRLALEEARRKAEAERRKVEEEARRKAEVERQKEKEAAAQRERLAAEKAVPRAAPGAAPAPGAPSGSEIAARALEQLRTPGALRVDPPPARPAGPGGVRRRAVLRGERDVDLRFYVESWRAKIERYGALNYRPGAARAARDYPVVTVSIRSDGSVEDVLISRSSGVRELDEAARRIAQLYAPYSVFPPALARQFDVIEIRRVWQFDETLRIVEEM